MDRASPDWYSAFPVRGALESRDVYKRQEGESEFWGQSFVADYYGQIVAKAPVSDEAILYAELDLDALEDHRRIWPFFRDRRIDSYGGITERLSLIHI